MRSVYYRVGPRKRNLDSFSSKSRLKAHFPIKKTQSQSQIQGLKMRSLFYL